MALRYTPDILTSEVWERIAFYAVASEDTFLGPPSMICSLALLSRLVYAQISFKNNPRLYARIFRFKFDASAPARRLSERWRTTKCLASELIKRCRAMKRIKTKDLNVDDVWTAYLMMSENDGKNEAQLIQWADLKSYLRALIIYRGTSYDLAWFKNPTLDSLVVWLLWETSERESIRVEGSGSDFREYLLGLLHSFIITGYRHSSTYGPDTHFSLPLCNSLSRGDITGWQSSPTSEIVHYSHRVQLVSPVVAPAAVLSLVVQADSFQDQTNIPLFTSQLPLTRADAITQGQTGPTVADVLDFHLNTRPPTLTRCKLVIDGEFIEDLEVIQDAYVDSNESGRQGSFRHDEDWYRLAACHDPWIGDLPLRGVVYTPGMLAGCWAGRLLVADFELYTSLINHQFNPSTVSVRHEPLYWELKEHHCLSPNDPLTPGMDDWGDDLLNAWLPRGATFTHLEDSLEVYDPNTGHTAIYETVISGNAALYSSTSASEKLSRSWISDASDGEIAGLRTVESGFSNQEIRLDSTSTIDDDDEYCDTVSHRSTGISDILITGRTGETYGEAWGHYEIVGRVRPWDGLVVLLRVPSNPLEQHLGRWIFKGYLHDQNFVGRWRETSTPLDSIGYEGGFVVYKMKPAREF
ncbi:hypothetical protein GALMADRAFT_244185 [Galerina marginata CBS 339.88]|uniref:Uncharacterized protein n=1 Tax=Galerina marginata (strain CBS 339.88) TaxID=685588 RepID=A0A067T6B8_GALM3|nr:hypothetical protein GALMADRAFT_244185 [Galerina marginata CBS 339.88]